VLASVLVRGSVGIEQWVLMTCGAVVLQSHHHGDRNVRHSDRSKRAMGFFRPANDDDQGGEPSDDEDELVDDEVRDEAGEALPSPSEEAEPPA
jgi:hypothetical protein